MIFPQLDIPSKFRLFALTSRMKALRLAVISILCTAVGMPVFAQDGSSVTQSVTIEVKPITKIAINGTPATLIISDATAGSGLATVRDDNTSYSVLTNLESMKIVASINDRMPVGTKLLVALASSIGVSAGSVDISEAVSPVDVVTAIGRGSEMNQSISYVFAAGADVGEIPLSTRVVTLTLTN